MSDEDQPRYTVRYTERAEEERDAAFLRITQLLGPQYAGSWYKVLREKVIALGEFPGPLSHARDEEASALYGFEVRRMLYRGPTRRAATAYRVLFTLLPPNEENAVTILVLRVLHGARLLAPQSDA